MLRSRSLFFTGQLLAFTDAFDCPLAPSTGLPRAIGILWLSKRTRYGSIPQMVGANGT
jgi:hypothetical protein